MRRRALLTLAAGLPVAALAQPARPWPERPLRLIVPFPPGGAIDAMSRILAGPMADALGQPVVVENRAGAGGTPGTGVAAQANDGHALLMVSIAHAVNTALYPRLPYPDQPPVKSGAALCDFLAGIHLYAAIVTALYDRERTGEGGVVDVSMQDATYASLASNLGMLQARGAAAPARTGNRHGGLGVSPYNVYPATDGYVVLNAPGDHHFRAILDVMGRGDLKDDPRFLTRSTRVQNFQAVDELIESWTRLHSRNDIARLMQKAKVPCAPVRELSEVMADENMLARGSLQWQDHPEMGRIVVMHSPLVFEGRPRHPLQPSLPLGASNEAVYGTWLGHPPEELATLRAEGVIS